MREPTCADVLSCFAQSVNITDVALAWLSGATEVRGCDFYTFRHGKVIRSLLAEPLSPDEERELEAAE
jgi:hypothetical protein